MKKFLLRHGFNGIHGENYKFDSCCYQNATFWRFGECAPHIEQQSSHYRSFLDANNVVSQLECGEEAYDNSWISVINGVRYY